MLWDVGIMIVEGIRFDEGWKSDGNITELIEQQSICEGGLLLLLNMILNEVEGVDC